MEPWPALYTLARRRVDEEPEARKTITSAVIIGLVLITYPNVLALVVARRSWDQWASFTTGNLILITALSGYVQVSGRWSTVWGSVSARGLWIGIAAGTVPLAVIVALIFGTQGLSADIVKAGIGEISRNRFLLRMGVQVAIATVLCEELAFRGVLQSMLTGVISPALTMGVVGMAYGLWHAVLQYNAFSSRRWVARAAASAGGVAIYTLLGLLLALTREMTGGLAAPLAAHGVLDIAMFAAMYARRRGRIMVSRHRWNW